MEQINQYLEKGKEVLKILINNGCEAYLIGGCVCNTILQIPFDEIEITTNATPDMLKGIFSQAKVEENSEGSIKLYYLGYQFVINTFRIEEKHKDNRKPSRYHYSKNLHDDLACRDFTINAIAMSYGGKLTDAYRGFEDIQRKKVRTIGNPRVRFNEDPLRLLIAIRFVSELGFKIERRTFKAMKAKYKLLANLKIEEMIFELKRIMNGKHFKKALNYIIETNLYKKIPILNKEFKRLYNHYRKTDVDTIIACAFVKNGSFVEELAYLSSDVNSLKKVVELAINNPKSKYDSLTIFNNGLEICQHANYVNWLLKKSKKKTRNIRKNYNLLPIKNESELAFSRKDIFELTNNQAALYVQTILDQMIEKIIKGELENEHDALKIYTINALKEMSIITNKENSQVISSGENLNEYKDRKYEDNISEEKINDEKYINHETSKQTYYNEYQNTNTIEPLYTNSKLDQIERRVNEYERSLREKEEQIKELELKALEYKLDNDVNNIVGQNLELLKEMNYIEKGTEKVLLSRELKEMYRGLITNVDPKYRSLKEKKINREGNDLNNEK